MMKTKRVLCAVCALMFVLAVLFPITASSLSLKEEWDAQEALEAYTYTNPETGFQARILDRYGLLSTEEKDRLLEEMKPLTEYGNIGFSSYESSGSGDDNEADSQAKDAKNELFYEKSNRAVFVVGRIKEQDDSGIRVPARREALYCDGAFSKRINHKESEEILDDAEPLVENDQYYSAASKVFRQMTELAGEGVAHESFRYLSYSAISLVLGLIIAISFSFLTHFNPGIRKPEDVTYVPSQQSTLKITKNHLIFKRRIDSIDD